MTDEVVVPKKLTMRECCAILGIHKSTFKRRMKDGIYGKGVSEGLQSKPGEVRRYFTAEDIRLDFVPPVPPVPEPEQETQQALIDIVAPTVHAAPVIQHENTEDFAAAYRAGRATDSCGNRADGTNKNYSATVTLLGPHDEGHRQSVLDTQAHMNQGLIETQAMIAADGVKPPTHPDGDFRTRSGQTLAPGLSKETYLASLAQWDATHNGPERLSMSEQREAQERSKTMIHAAFPKP